MVGPSTRRIGVTGFNFRLPNEADLTNLDPMEPSLPGGDFLTGETGQIQGPLVSTRISQTRDGLLRPNFWSQDDYDQVGWIRPSENGVDRNSGGHPVNQID